jgi:hypothetical protein
VSRFNIRHRAVVGGSISLPLGFQFMPFVMAQSGAPYNITLGRDLIGTAILNQRPAFAAPGATGLGIVATNLGTFNINPAPGEPVIPINLGMGPTLFTANFHLSKPLDLAEKSTFTAADITATDMDSAAAG